MSRSKKWLIVTIIVVLILLLFRMKAIAPASILSFILFLSALIERIMRIQAIRRSMGGQASAPKGSLTLKEAREIFELGERYTKEDVKKAHHRLIKKIHPDTGGSKYITSQINEAKDILMKELKK